MSIYHLSLIQCVNGRRSIRNRQKARRRRRNARRKGRRYQSLHQPLFLGQNQMQHAQQRHLQNVDAQKTAPLMVTLLISMIFSAQPMGYHVVTT
ncbi:hypothetical protein DPMN_177667 [Dreissena polymorpha]|uniref:Uncharacterized protein n=1 Tax=Dreissena polymorpha TaxID=45954 RepID=A0A9D4E9F3_DREPO|nr:hypothetical protein DPMN_177667 [Dreissena polymorpha]